MDSLTQAPALSINLTMTAADYAALAREEKAVELAESFVVDSPEMAGSTNCELRLVKGRIKAIKDKKAAFVLPAKQIITEAEGLFDPAIKALEQAEVLLKSRLSAWVTEQARIADESRRAAEAEARKLAQEAERKAAIERAKAEEQAAAQRRAAEEAEAARQRAVAEGNAAAAAKAAADAAAAEQKAAAIQENAAAKAQEFVIAASAAAPVAVHAAKAPAGFSMRDNWIAEIPAGKTEADALRSIVAEIATGKRDELFALLSLDMSAATRLAKALKTAFNVPGLTACNRPVAASRSK